SLVCHPASMTHGSIPYELRQKIGIVDNLIRLSIGIENPEDLIKDLKNALKESR
ncbi:PLP-dependent transferase, partial [Enterobacter quasiroggenkampii]|nr:PLP-dependent transferase [Enterobacter quasiroggenkampii]